MRAYRIDDISSVPAFFSLSRGIICKKVHCPALLHVQVCTGNSVSSDVTYKCCPPIPHADFQIQSFKIHSSSLI
uniref:Uncharacterized protein n=1 Tax=Arion vulgaris TaxID=1028688 RepID=A0A0B7AK45_9EUPU